MFSTFVLGAGALLSPWRMPSLALLLIGFSAVRDNDVMAAQQGEAPRYFSRLRPAQMTVPLFSLGALLMLDILRRSPARADIGRDRRAIEATGKPVSELGSAR